MTTVTLSQGNCQLKHLNDLKAMQVASCMITKGIVSFRISPVPRPIFLGPSRPPPLCAPHPARRFLIAIPSFLSSQIAPKVKKIT